MAEKIEEIRKEIAELSSQAKNELLKELISELDGPAKPGAEKAWLDECERRLRELDNGTVQAVPANLVFENARKKLNG